MEKEGKNTLNWKEIGQRFRDLRKQHNYDQSDLIDLSKQTGGAISQYELGVTPASTNYALFLRNEFGASFDWLYDGVVIDRAYEDVQTKKIIDPHAIGVRIKAIRKEKGMTQGEFGALVGLTHAGISKIENGHRTPEIKTALKIKRALGKPLDWIYFGDEPIIPKKSRLRANANKSNQIKSIFSRIQEKVKVVRHVLHNFLQPLFVVLKFNNY
ncbi:helix-turn-helix transcriptional regulator [Candidatus Liberibacter solanacearum]|uniref:helix-turn-helix transcriptional regulator n=1 Tax=Candidatus Liberibacter solanacearum TaxID=556287 RepID=UPI000C7F5F37|nr:helix-turn-helix transcriptional regulator [Candidatus Liberibacter solanacearum]